MNKTELINAFAQANNFSKKQASEVLDALLDIIISALSDKHEVKIIGFGTFKLSHVKAKTVTNPHSKKQMEVPAYNRIRFIPGQAFKDSVNS